MRDAERLPSSVAVVKSQDAQKKDEPLNVRLKEKKISTAVQPLRLVPRRYQEELCAKAIRENVIIYLGTGLGKTFITVLFLNDAHIDSLIQSGRKVAFLAPTQDLIKQQAEYINKQVPYRVRVYCGRSARCGLHIDHWDKSSWDNELENVEILFLTPQVFLNAIATSLLQWDQFCAVIFDEFHHASRSSKKKTSNHHYAQLLNHYQVLHNILESPKPRLVGLTASLINRMPKDREDIRSEVEFMERAIFGTCFTDIDVQDTRPTSIIHSFTAYKLNDLNDILCQMFKNFIDSLNEALKANKEKCIVSKNPSQLTADEKRTCAFLNRLKLAASGFSIKPASFPKVMYGLRAIRERCGLWPLRAVTYRLLKALEKHCINPCLPKEMKEIYKDFTLMLQTLHAHLDSFLNCLPDNGLLLHARPKLKSLLERLKFEYDRTIEGVNGKKDFSCVVFVISRLEVVALNTWLQTVSHTLDEYKFLNCDYAIGLAATASSKYACITKRKAIEQYMMLKDFREKRLNVITTTSVLEEGIDLPVCSTVVRYDMANNFRQYVQSRGRARQEISTFVTLCDQADYLKIVDNLDKFGDFELTLKKTLTDKDISPSIRVSRPYIAPPPEDTQDFYTSEDKLVRISDTTARTILSMYCNQVSQRTPFTEGVRYERIDHPASCVQTILFLPSGCPLSKQGIAGNIKSDTLLADNSAVIAALKALIDAGEVDKRGVPTRINSENVDSLLSTMNLEPKFEQLDKRLEGIRIVEGERESFYFEPYLRNDTYCLRTDFMEKTYKLIKIRFIASREDTREETRPFFEKPVFGIIVDSRTNNEWIPPFLNSHYGQYEVQFLEVCNNITIKNPADHNRYLSYTHNLLYKYLSVFGLRKEHFINHCRFYIVPLDKDDKPDGQKMRQVPSASLPQPGHIVKLNSYYTAHRDRYSKRDDRLFLIRSVRMDMNANSIIPGRRNLTFLQDAEEKYGRQVVASNRIDSPLIEVMPLSREFGQVNETKKSRRDYKTDSLFFIEQFLDLFDTDAAYVFQASMLPELIYRLYITLNAYELDQKFQRETTRRRQVSLHQVSMHELEELELDHNENDDIEMEDEVCQQLSVDRSKLDGDKEREAGEEDDSDAESEDFGADSISSNDTEYSDIEMVGPDYNEMLTKKALRLDDDEENLEDLKKWDMTQYKETNIIKQQHEHYLSDSKPEPYLNSSEFVVLQNEFSDLQHKLINQIEAFEGRITSNENFLDESAEFEKRTDRVDRSIAPPIHFDRNTKPLREGSRERSLIEALTLRRASERYSLEGLEHAGDSYLKYLVSVVLYMRLSGNEGFLTAARSRLTSNEHFTYLAKKRSLGSYAITKSFSKDYLTYILGKVDDGKGSSRNDEKRFWNKMGSKNLADTVESIVGSYLVYHSEFEAILATEWLGLEIFDENTFVELHEKAVVFSKPPTALIDNDNADILTFYKASKSKVRRLEEILDYKFNDPSYLVQAITHASAYQKCTRSYERLEFLGDAILDYLVTTTLIKEANLNDPGQMTSSRSALVNNCAFAKLAMRYKFDLFIQHCNSGIYDELIKVRNAMEEDPDMDFMDIIDFDKIVKLLGDVFESVAGAIYLDSGCSLDSVWSIYYPMMKQAIDEEIQHPTKNLKALLHEMFPGRNRIEFESYDLKTEEGSLVSVTCNIVDVGEFTGKGITRKEARKRAVREAVKNAPSLEERIILNREYEAKHGDKSRQTSYNRRGPPRGGRQGGHSRTGRNHGSRR